MGQNTNIPLYHPFCYWVEGSEEGERGVGENKRRQIKVTQHLKQIIILKQDPACFFNAWD